MSTEATFDEDPGGWGSGAEFGDIDPNDPAETAADDATPQLYYATV